MPRGVVVDFTDNHDRVREGLMATVGRATPYKGRFFMSLSEAIAAYEHSDSMLRNQLILRECAAVLANPVEAARCEIEVEQEAGEFVNYQRQQTQASLHGMREVLKEGVRSGAFVYADAKLLSFAILGAVNWIPRWYSPDGPSTSEEIAEKFADYLIAGLRRR